MAIQCKVIIEYLMTKIANGPSDEDYVKIQKMFNITNDNDINYGIKETDAD